MAVERGSNVRWLLLETGDQTALVVAGPHDGLLQAVSDGWLVPGGRGMSEDSRAYERQMLEQMRSEDQPQ